MTDADFSFDPKRLANVLRIMRLHASKNMTRPHLCVTCFAVSARTEHDNHLEVTVFQSPYVKELAIFVMPIKVDGMDARWQPPALTPFHAAVPAPVPAVVEPSVPSDPT